MNGARFLHHGLTPFSAVFSYRNPVVNKKLKFQRTLPVKISSGNGERSEELPTPPTITPPESVEIKFRRVSKKRKRKLADKGGEADKYLKVKSSVSDTPKKWEDKSIPEKAVELYMGEKGLLFWLNKFAYASIFIVIGGWILFRFVGPALNLYQLDSSLLSPSSMFKGS